MPVVRRCRRNARALAKIEPMPARAMSPVCGRTSPLRERSKVDLPAPEGPSSTVKRLLANSTVVVERAVTPLG